MIDTSLRWVDDRLGIAGIEVIGCEDSSADPDAAGRVWLACAKTA